MIPGNMQIVLDVVSQIINFQIVEKKTLYDKIIVPILGKPDEDEGEDEDDDTETETDDTEDTEDKSSLKQYFKG